MSLSALESRLSAAQAELKRYMTRQGQVNTILNSISSCSSNNQSTINPKLEKTISDSESGIKDCLNIGAQNNTLSGMKEQTNDSNMDGANSSMQSELKRVNDEISRLQAEINSLRLQIAAELESQAKAQDVIAATATKSERRTRTNSDGSTSSYTVSVPDTARRSEAARQAASLRAQASAQRTAAATNNYFK